jgi:hypothetical protein
VDTNYHDFLRLAWSYNAEVRGSDLLPDTPHWLDVFAVRKGTDRLFLGTATSALAYANGFDVGWYRFTVQLSAENAGPEKANLYVLWPGTIESMCVLDEAGWPKVKGQLVKEDELLRERIRQDEAQRREQQDAAEAKAKPE